MRVDLYTKATLTIIALCLLTITFRSVSWIPEVRAAGRITCTGQLKANAWGGVKESIGGYVVEVSCD